MAYLSFNGNFTGFPQPTTLKESHIQKVVDRTSIKGVRHRYWLRAVWEVEMTFTAISISDYNTLAGYFLFQGNGVAYNNTASGVSFFGYPVVAEDTYIPGASFLRNMTVKLEEQ